MIRVMMFTPLTCDGSALRTVVIMRNIETCGSVGHTRGTLVE